MEMGRPRNFKSPNELIEAWKEFKEDLKQQANEWLRVQYVGKDSERMTDPQKVPMTYEGFKIYCRANDYGDVKNYFDNYQGSFGEFTDVCSHIKEEIRNNQIIGGMLGFYNPSITQRLNGLTDKQEVKLDVQDDVEIVLHPLQSKYRPLPTNE